MVRLAKGSKEALEWGAKMHGIRKSRRGGTSSGSGGGVESGSGEEAPFVPHQPRRRKHHSPAGPKSDGKCPCCGAAAK
jgi:hypothetical protein